MNALRASAGTVLTAGLLFAGVVAVPAQASAAEGTGGHCVYNLSTDTTACYSTFRAATADATNGKVTDAPISARAALADTSLQKRLDGPMPTAGVGTREAVDYLLSIEYDIANLSSSGGTLTIKGNAPCVEDGQRDYTFNDVRDAWPSWNDRISSFQGYNTCDVNHYEHQVINGGDTTGPKRSMTTMGSMSNKTTGLTFG
ncbi:hypothetical protein [Streptomyces spongiae]|uniref:Uncharacterized protein n=1 Tax=Streptomyces spongiae TaxID=565072 RepID=A0A5N8XZD2_9ACTN|nr:hypothetical protein [Streptomyces spongiae]MPY64095.1 hypothetical protein [Streptomyces spongiae]